MQKSHEGRSAARCWATRGARAPGFWPRAWGKVWEWLWALASKPSCCWLLSSLWRSVSPPAFRGHDRGAPAIYVFGRTAASIVQPEDRHRRFAADLPAELLADAAEQVVIVRHAQAPRQTGQPLRTIQNRAGG